MKEITVYECLDGSRFDSKQEAEKYEILLSKCNEIESKLININRDLYINEYIQQNLENVKNLFKLFMNLVGETMPKYRERALECGSFNIDITHMDIPIFESKLKCIKYLYNRFCRISFRDGKEYIAPYCMTNYDFKYKKVPNKYIIKKNNKALIN